MLRTRTIWIDVLKGIAIIFVVVGHSSSYMISDFIACFHMPLFFLLSGWLFSPKEIKIYAISSTRRLLLPYICFLFVISLPQIITCVSQKEIGGGIALISKMLYGGYYLQGIYAVFWFITVLWMASNLFNIIVDKAISSIWLPLLIFVAYLCYLTPKPLPWNIHIVPMATAYIWIGFLLKSREEYIKKLISSQRRITFCAVFVSLLIIYIFRESLTFSMKYGEYGIPVISFITSVIASICVAMIAFLLSNVPLMGKTFSFIGLASMVIMYLHMPVKYYLTLKIAPSDLYFVHIICGLFLSVIAFWLLKKTDFTKKYFLGEKI